MTDIPPPSPGYVEVVPLPPPTYEGPEPVIAPVDTSLLSEPPEPPIPPLYDVE